MRPRALNNAIDAAAAASIVRRTLDANVALHERVKAGGAESVVRAAEAIRSALASGRKVLAFGNGGSAADAQHLTTELGGRFQKERAGFPAI